jgi:hypothetical protein
VFLVINCWIPQTSNLSPKCDPIYIVDLRDFKNILETSFSVNFRFDLKVNELEIFHITNIKIHSSVFRDLESWVLISPHGKDECTVFF